MIDLETFKSELKTAVLSAEEKDGTGPDVHAKILEYLLLDIKESWHSSNDALGEVMFVVNKVFPKSDI